MGSINLDAVLTVDALPSPGETVLCRRAETFPGGKGANQAVAAARMGAKTLLIGAVGRDAASETLVKGLAAEGIDLSQVARIKTSPTGTAHICVAADGRNTIVVSQGANAAVSATQIRPEALGDCAVFLGQFETPLPALEALLRSEAARRAIKIINAAPAIPEGGALLGLADVVVVNESELARHAGLAAEPDSRDAVVQAARGLICRLEQIVIVTLGAEGVVAVGASAVIDIAGRPATVVDTTGAGDCFCGVLAAWLASGAKLRDAIVAANAAAALSVGRAGATPSMPARAAVEAALLE